MKYENRIADTCPSNRYFHLGCLASRASGCIQCHGLKHYIETHAKLLVSDIHTVTLNSSHSEYKSYYAKEITAVLNSIFPYLCTNTFVGTQGRTPVKSPAVLAVSNRLQSCTYSPHKDGFICRHLVGFRCCTVKSCRLSIYTVKSCRSS